MLIILAGCASAQTAPAPLAVGTPFWPSNGEPVRIRYLYSFNKPEELGIRQGGWSRLWSFLVGDGRKKLVNPVGITTDNSGTIFVLDAAGKNVLIFDRKNSEYRFLPDEDEMLLSPAAVVVDDPSQRLFVSDADSGLVHIFPLSAGQAPAELGKGILKRPTGIAINRHKKELLVLDTKLGAVFRFDLADLKLIGSFGNPGTAGGEFNRPADLKVNRNGELLVCDSLNFRVQIFDQDGRFIRAFGSPGNGPGSFNRPRSLAEDSDGNIYVLDNLFDNIQIFNSKGELLLDFGQHGKGAGRFWMPSSIHIDQNDQIYIADTYNRQVQVFQYIRQGVQP